jgi:hypothetical protein
MGVGVVVVETLCDLPQDCGGGFTERLCRVGREVSEAFIQSALGFGEEFEKFV